MNSNLQADLGYIRLLLLLLSAWSMTACATRYDVTYGWELKAPESSAHLAFEDEHFAFSFVPTAAGIAFQIRNKTGQEASLDWDQSFFVQPDGNSYKALNTDTLDENSLIAMKSRYSTIIPSNAGVMRFTTASVNPYEVTSVSISQVGSMYSSTFLRWEPGVGYSWAESSTATSFQTLAVTSAKGGYLFPRYRDITLTATEAELPVKLEALSRAIREQPRMGLGLSLLRDGNATLYRFEFEVTDIFLSADVKEGQKSILRQDALCHVSRAANNWVWEDLRPKPEPRLQLRQVDSDESGKRAEASQ